MPSYRFFSKNDGPFRKVNKQEKDMISLSGIIESGLFEFFYDAEHDKERNLSENQGLTYIDLEPISKELVKKDMEKSGLISQKSKRLKTKRDGEVIKKGEGAKKRFDYINDKLSVEQGRKDYILSQVRNLNKALREKYESIGILNIRAGYEWKLVARDKKAKINMASSMLKRYFVGRNYSLQEINKQLSNFNCAFIVGTGGIGKSQLALKYAMNNQVDYTDGIYLLRFDIAGKSGIKKAIREMLILLYGVDADIPATEEEAKAALFYELQGSNALLILDGVEDPAQIVMGDFHVIVTTRDKWLAEKQSQGNEIKLKEFSAKDSERLLKKRLGNNRVDSEKVAAKSISEILGNIPLAIDIFCSIINERDHIQDEKSLYDWIAIMTTTPITQMLEREEGFSEKDKSVFISFYASLLTISEIKEDSEAIINVLKATTICAPDGFRKETMANAVCVGLEKISEYLTCLNDMSLVEIKENSGSILFFTHPLIRDFSKIISLENKNDNFKFVLNYCMYFLNFTNEYKNNPRELILNGNEIFHAIVNANLLDDPKTATNIIKNMEVTFNNYIENNKIQLAYIYLVDSCLINIHYLGYYKELSRMLEVLMITSNFRELRDVQKSVVTLMIGICLQMFGEYDKAIYHHNKSRDLSVSLNHKGGEASAIGNIGICYWMKGKIKEATEYLNMALKIFRDDLNEKTSCVSQLFHLGHCYRDKTDLDKAEEYYNKSLKIALEVGDRLGPK